RRARKAELDRAKAEYEDVLFLPDAPAQAARLARLAETLRRRLEAWILWKLDLALRPGDPNAVEGLRRIDAQVQSPVPPDASLPALLAMLDRSSPDASIGSGPRTEDDAGPTPAFTDDAEAAGIRFTFDSGAEPLHHLPEITSGGVGLLDYDGDGWLDVYFVQGGPFP